MTAIGWLNQSSVDCDFNLVKIEAIKIGESDPAAQFTLISGPSETSKAIGKIKKEDGERHNHYLYFRLGYLALD